MRRCRAVIMLRTGYRNAVLMGIADTVVKKSSQQADNSVPPAELYGLMQTPTGINQKT